MDDIDNLRLMAEDAAAKGDAYLWVDTRPLLRLFERTMLTAADLTDGELTDELLRRLERARSSDG